MKKTFLFAMKAVELSLPNAKVKMKEWLSSISRPFLTLLSSLNFFFHNPNNMANKCSKNITYERNSDICLVSTP